MVKIKSSLKLIKLIKTARVVRGGCMCNGCDVVAAAIGESVMAFCNVKFRRVLGKFETNHEKFHATFLLLEVYSKKIQVG